MDIAGFDVDGSAMETLAAEGITNLGDFSCMKLVSFKKSELDQRRTGPDSGGDHVAGDLLDVDTFPESNEP